MRSLTFEFPDDKEEHIEKRDRQFLVGSALLVSPVLDKGHTRVNAYFPPAIWYDYYTGNLMPYSGQEAWLDAPIDHINVHIRGGYIVPQQTPKMTLTESRKSNYQYLVALDKNV